MSVALSQDHQAVVLESPFSRNVLTFLSMSAEEGLSTPFRYRIEAASTQANLDFDRALGQGCSVGMSTHKKAERWFHGVMTSAEWLGKRGDIHHYTITLEPWLSLLEYTSDCRFFKKMTVVDIIRKVFTSAGFSDFEFRLNENYPTIEYCTQYRETHFNFVTRLMEQYGIFYYFEHTRDKHDLILADGRSSLKPNKDLASLPYQHVTQANFRQSQRLEGWKPTRRFRTGKVALNDFDYLKPNARLLAESALPGRYTRGDMEAYDYHANYTELPVGQRFAKVRVEEHQAADFRRDARGDAPSLYPGGLVQVTNLDEGSENKEYLVVLCTHRLSLSEHRSGATAEVAYEGSYCFQPSDRPFRAPPTARRPIVPGLQTAKVVGAEGEEIDVDEHGRVLVQFHWDRDKKQSRRVRVAQSWAANTWGGIVLPRIGMEVVVEFVEGDPDHPLVTGAVYNGTNRPPYPLPDNKTMSGMKSRSSKGDNGYNEFVFEDKAGEEKIRLHGERDLELKIKHQETREIGEEFPLPRGAASRSTTLKAGDDELTIETGGQKVKIGASQDVDVGESITLTANVSIELVVGLSRITMTPGSISISSPVIDVTGAASISTTAPLQTVTGAASLTLMGALIRIN